MALSYIRESIDAMTVSLSLLQTIETLSQASIKHQLSPYIDFEWPEKLDLNQWMMSPELISLYRHPLFKTLSEDQQKKLSFYECVNFFGLNIHGERALIQGLASRLYRQDCPEISKYLHHFLDEENDHMVYFGTFCEKYAGKVYPDRKFSFAREYQEGEEDFLFFAKILVFEEIVDVFNLKMSKDERLHPLIKEINRRHHFDETRHLVFGRRLTKELFDTYSPKWGEAKCEELRTYMSNYIQATCKEYVNPDVYQDAGLANPYELAEQVIEAADWKIRSNEMAKNAIKFFVEIGLLKTEAA